MALTMRGQGGRLMVGWHEAGSLGAWSLSDGTLRYALAASDPFWLTQPLTRVELPVGRQTLIWHVTALDGRGGAVALPGTPDERQPR